MCFSGVRAIKAEITPEKAQDRGHEDGGYAHKDAWTAQENPIGGGNNNSNGGGNQTKEKAGDTDENSACIKLNACHQLQRVWHDADANKADQAAEKYVF